MLLFAGLGVLIGFALSGIVGGTTGDSAATGVFIGIGLMLASVALFFFDREVMQKHLDKPRAIMLTQQYNPPITNPDGSLTYARQVPAVHPETGQPVVMQPTSSLFFIPVRFWPFILGGLGLLIFAINLIIVLAQG